jgi:hypothetical protein
MRESVLVSSLNGVRDTFSMNAEQFLVVELELL